MRHVGRGGGVSESKIKDKYQTSGISLLTPHTFDETISDVICDQIPCNMSITGNVCVTMLVLEVNTHNLISNVTLLPSTSGPIR